MPAEPAPDAPPTILGVRRETFFKWLAVFIILVFATGPLIYFFSGQAPEPTPTPTITPRPEEYFQGVGAAPARVLKLSADLLVECPNATRAALDAAKAVPGVTLALQAPGTSVMNVRLNASLNESGFQQAAGRVEDALWDYCEPRFYRNADLLLEEAVNLTDPDTNKTRTYNQRTLSTLFQQLGFRSVNGWVTLKAALNETIGITVVVRIQPPEQPFAFIQEERPVFEALQARTAVLAARLLELRNEALARVEVPWERRGSFEPAALEARLNESLGGLGARASYSPRHSIAYLIGLNESGWNETRAALANLSFARGTNAREDAILVFVDGNYTARSQALSELLARVPGANASRVQFPASELGLTLNFTNGTSFESMLATLEALAPGEVAAAKRVALASFVNATEAKAALGIGRVPESFEAFVSGSAKAGDVLSLNVFASARGKRVVSLRGEEQKQ